MDLNELIVYAIDHKVLTEIDIIGEDVFVRFDPEKPLLVCDRQQEISTTPDIVLTDNGSDSEN